MRVLVVGQDPYPTPGHPIGLSFAVDPGVWPLPRSLVNIYVELRDDTGMVPPRSGDLTPWSDQGVMLLNRVLTVRPGESASHRGRGWEEITEHAISVLVRRAESRLLPCAAILWGRDAQSLKPASARSLGSSRPIPRRCRRAVASSARDRSPGSTGCWSSRAPTPVDWSLGP